MIRRTRTIREGDARRAAQRAAEIRAKLADETARHRVAVQSIAARRSQAALKPDAAARAAALAVVTAAAAKEDQRHHGKVRSIKNRLDRR